MVSRVIVNVLREVYFMQIYKSKSYSDKLYLSSTKIILILFHTLYFTKNFSIKSRNLRYLKR